MREPSLELVRSLAYNTDSYDYLNEIISSNYLVRQIGKDELLETWIILLHTGVQFEKLRRDFIAHLAAATPREYWNAFQREIGLLDREVVVDQLVEFGFSEILESLHRLSTGEELQFYVDKLDANQLEQLLAQTEAPTREVLEMLVIEAEPRAPWPVRPPSFRTADSLWQWHRDFIRTNHISWAHAWTRSAASNAIQLFGNLEKDTGSLENCIVLLRGAKKFYVRMDGQLVDFETAAATLKEKASKADPLYGKTLAAVHAYLGDNVSEKLIATELLKQEECDRYMIQRAGDVVHIDPIRAAELGSGQFDSRLFNSRLYNSRLYTPPQLPIIFPREYLSEPSLRTAIMLLIRAAPGSLLSSVTWRAQPVPFLSAQTDSSWVVIRRAI